MVGTLFAAKSGEELREDICARVMDFVDTCTGKPSSQA
jgi:hypothetical protein